MPPPQSSSPKGGCESQTAECALRGDGAVAAVPVRRLSSSSLRRARPTEAAETTAPSTLQVLRSPSRPLGQKRHVSGSLQPRGDVDTTPAVVRVEAARSVTNTGWFYPLSALERQRQTAADAYIPFTIVSAEAESSQRARLGLATIAVDSGCCDGGGPSTLTTLPLLRSGPVGTLKLPGERRAPPPSVRQKPNVDTVIPTQDRYFTADRIPWTSLVATEPPPRKFRIHEYRSRPCQSAGSRFPATPIKGSRRGSTARPCTRDEGINTLAVNVDAAFLTQSTPARIPSLPVLPAAASSEAYTHSISLQYARLNRLIKGYRASDHHLTVASHVASGEAATVLTPEMATNTLSPRPPATTSAARLTFKPSLHSPRRSFVSLAAPPSFLLSTPGVHHACHSTVHVCRQPLFASLTPSTSRAREASLTGAHKAFPQFLTDQQQPQPHGDLPSTTAQRPIISPFAPTDVSRGTHHYTRNDRAHFQRSCASTRNRHHHSLFQREQKQRTHIALGASHALNTLHSLHIRYRLYIESHHIPCTEPPAMAPQRQTQQPFAPLNTPHVRDTESQCHNTNPHTPTSFTPQSLYSSLHTATEEAAEPEALVVLEGTLCTAAEEAAEPEALVVLEGTSCTAAEEAAVTGVCETCDADNCDLGGRVIDACDTLCERCVWVGDFSVGGSGRAEGEAGVMLCSYRCGVPEVAVDAVGRVVRVSAVFPDLSLSGCGDERGVGAVFSEFCSIRRGVVVDCEHVLRGPGWCGYLLAYASQLRELVIADVSATLDCAAVCVRNVHMYACAVGVVTRDNDDVAQQSEDDVLRITVDVIQEATSALHPLGGVRPVIDGCRFPYLQQWRRSRDEWQLSGDGVLYDARSSNSAVMMLFGGMKGDASDAGERGVVLPLWAYSVREAAPISSRPSMVVRSRLPFPRVADLPEGRNSNACSFDLNWNAHHDRVLADPEKRDSADGLMESDLLQEVRMCQLTASMQDASRLSPMPPSRSTALQMATPFVTEEMMVRENGTAHGLLASRSSATPLMAPTETLRMVSQHTEMAVSPKEARHETKRSGFLFWKRKQK